LYLWPTLPYRVTLGIMASGSKSDIKKHYKRGLHYTEQAGAVEGYVVHFTMCPDSKQFLISPPGLSVVIFRHNDNWSSLEMWSSTESNQFNYTKIK